MKKVLFALFSIFVILSCKETKKADGNLHLTGNIKGLNTGTIYIQKVVDTVFATIDSIKIDGDSKFETYLNIESPEMLYLFLDRGITNSLDNNLPFFAEPGKMNIETQLDQYYAKAKINGSKNQELFEQYKKVNARYKDQRLGLTEEKFWSGRNNNKAKADSLQKVQDRILKREYLYAINFVIQNKDHEVAPYIALSEIPHIQPEYRDMIQKAMSPKIMQSHYGKKLTEYYETLKNEESK